MARARKTQGWGGRREGAGRKPTDPREHRAHAVMVRLTTAELKAVRAAAKGLPLATWIHELVVRATRSRS
jgi:hypothetical protein